MKSVAEQDLIDFWKELEECNFINMKDILQFRDKLGKVMEKCEELRKSRDNWRKRYEEKS